MTWLAVQLLGSAAMVAAGITLARRSRPAATATVGAMVLLIVLKAVVGYVPAGEARLFPWDWYPFVEHWWILFPAVLVLTVAIAIFWASWWKRDGLMILGGVFAVHCAAVAILMARPHGLTGEIDAKGICHQTSGYSCSPASAVMLLHYAGISATEREMAELCVTRCGNSTVAGTSDSGAMRGLRLKMAGRGRPVISTPRYDELRAPAMVAIRIHDRMSHSIVVVKVGPDEVKVIDPLYGRGTIPRIQFERDWKGIAINLEGSGS